MRWTKDFDVPSITKNAQDKKAEFSNDVFAPKTEETEIEAANAKMAEISVNYTDLCLFRNDFNNQKTWEEEIERQNQAEKIETKFDSQMWAEDALGIK